MFSKQSAKTKIGLSLMTILCAVTLGFGVSNSVKASSDLDPDALQERPIKDGHWVPYKQLYVYHLKKGHKHYETFQWDEKDNRIQLVSEFYLNNKYGANHVVAPKTAKYDIKVKGVKYRPLTWYHSHTGNISYVKENSFKRTFTKGGYFNNSKFTGIGYGNYLIMKNGHVKHHPKEWQGLGMPYNKTANEAAYFFGYKNNNSYEIKSIKENLDGYYNGDWSYSESEVNHMKARYQKLTGKTYHYVAKPALESVSKEEEDWLKQF